MTSFPPLMTPTLTGRSTVLMLFVLLSLPGTNARSGMNAPKGTPMNRLLSTSQTEYTGPWAGAGAVSAPTAPTAAAMRIAARRYVSLDASTLLLSPARSSSPSLYARPPSVILSALALTSLWIGQRARAYASSAGVRGGRAGASVGWAVLEFAGEVTTSRTAARVKTPSRLNRTKLNRKILTFGDRRDSPVRDAGGWEAPAPPSPMA